TVMLVLSTPTRSQIIAHSNAGDANLTLGIKATVIPPSLPSLRPEDNVHITSGSRSNTANGTDNRSPQYLSSESRNASTGAVAISIPILRAALGPWQCFDNITRMRGSSSVASHPCVSSVDPSSITINSNFGSF